MRGYKTAGGYIPSEREEQTALVALVRTQYPELGRLLFAIPNGGSRNTIEAMHLKAEGVTPGVPDLFFAVPNSEYSGLFIEMKRTKGGRLTDAQKHMLQILNTIGYKAVVCYGCNDALAAIKEYIKTDYNKLWDKAISSED